MLTPADPGDPGHRPDPGPPPGAKPVVITPPGRWSLPRFSLLWESREVFLRFGARDLTLRYRQTALGVIWVVLQPLLTAGVFTLVFGKVAKLPNGGVPYFLLSYAGMLAWNSFSGILSRGNGSLVSNASLVSKVYFPRVLVPLSNAYAVMVDFAVAFVLMVVLLLAYGVNPGFAILALPVWVVLMVLLASGITVVAAALTVRYRDMQYIVPFVLQLLLYASPVAYTPSAVPSSYRLIFDVNPLAWILQEFRWSLIRQPLPPTWQVAGSFAVAVGAFVVGMFIFERMERGFADVI